MSIVFLGPPDSPTLSFLRERESAVFNTESKVEIKDLRDAGCEFIVSHGYRHIISRAVIAEYTPRIINMHISWLPWNRGADPNFWSFLEDTRKGVTIHIVDQGVDTGPILMQEEIEFVDTRRETLRTTYDCLQGRILGLLASRWSEIIAGEVRSAAQAGTGSSHRLRDKDAFMHLLQGKGWDTPIAEVTGKALTGK